MVLRLLSCLRRVVEWDEDLLINGRASLEALVRVGMGIGNGRRPSVSAASEYPDMDWKASYRLVEIYMTLDPRFPSVNVVSFGPVVQRRDRLLSFE